MALNPYQLARASCAACLLGLLALPATAELLQPGDLKLRHDIQMLADAGIIDAPITGWPLFLAGINVGGARIEALDPASTGALQRIFPSREPHTRPRLDFGIGGISEPERLRGYQNVPRESGEVSARLAWESGRYAGDLKATYVSDPVDGKEWRADGSYLGVALGNWFLSASATDRWWGPGRDGSMILSNNARPMPAITLPRREARPPGVRWLRWVVPWTTQVIFGQMEHDRHVPDTQFFGWRVGFKPLPNLEIGLSRTAQWCGEDEQNGLPSGHLAQIGLETWNAWGEDGASYRVHAEDNEPTCSAITDSDPNFGCAYNHHIYEDGYRYRGRVVGHSADGDSVVVSLGGLLFTAQGYSRQLLARRAEINRSNDARHSLSPVQRDIFTLELSHTRVFLAGDLMLGLGTEYGEVTATGKDIDETRAFVQWIWKLGVSN